MPATRAGKKTGVTKTNKRDQDNNAGPLTTYTQTQITPKKDPSRTIIQSPPVPTATSLALQGIPTRKQSTLDTWRNNSPIIPKAGAPASNTPREAQTDTKTADNAESETETPTTASPTKKRRRRDDSLDSSDFSMPDIQELLSANPKSQERIDHVRKRKFNHESEPTGIPDHSLQIERLLNAEDVELLSSIKDKVKREKCEQELIRRQLAAEKVKVMWMTGEIAKWKELSRRIRVGDNGPQDSWDSRQGAFNELLGELMGWRATWRKDDSHEV